MRSRITPLELRDLQAGEPATRLIDVRTGGEFEAVHIPGSYNVPLADLDEHGSTIAAIDDPVVLVCLSGGRAGQAEQALRSLGMPNLHVLDGGLTAWEREGGDVRRNATGRWSLERQVRLVAGLFVLGGVLGSVITSPLKWVAGAVGAGLSVAALTDTCAMGTLLSRLPYNRGSSCDIDEVVARLRADARA